MDRDNDTVRTLFFIAGIIATTFFGFTTDAEAISLKAAPLEYRTNLKTGESKKGFIDISNPTNEKVIVYTTVLAFRQTDNEGTLQFIDVEQLKQGIKLDLDSFELGPKEAIRMYFLLDGKLLPSGDVFGGIFFTTQPTKATFGSGQSVKLGTLLSIVNGTPGSRSAEVASMSVPFFSLSNELTGSYIIKNTGDPKNSTGFYPQVSTRVWPFGKEKVQTGKLVFAARSRENSFQVQTPPFGIYRVEASYGASIQSKWVVVAHPLAIIGLFMLLVATALLVKLRRRRTSIRLGKNN